MTSIPAVLRSRERSIFSNTTYRTYSGPIILFVSLLHVCFKYDVLDDVIFLITKTHDSQCFVIFGEVFLFISKGKDDLSVL